MSEQRKGTTPTLAAKDKSETVWGGQKWKEERRTVNKFIERYYCLAFNSPHLTSLAFRATLGPVKCGPPKWLAPLAEVNDIINKRLKLLTGGEPLTEIYFISMCPVLVECCTLQIMSVWCCFKRHEKLCSCQRFGSLRVPPTVHRAECWICNPSGPHAGIIMPFSFTSLPVLNGDGGGGGTLQGTRDDDDASPSRIRILDCSPRFNTVSFRECPQAMLMSPAHMMMALGLFPLFTAHYIAINRSVVIWNRILYTHDIGLVWIKNSILCPDLKSFRFRHSSLM